MSLVIVFFDIEATGLTVPPDIIQLGAVSPFDDNCVFNQYAKPCKPMEQSAMGVTGLKVEPGSRNLIKTFPDGSKEIIRCREVGLVLRDFINWLRDLPGRRGRKVMLAAYGCLRFDAYVLLYHLHKNRVPYDHVIFGFADLYHFVRNQRLDLGDRRAMEGNKNKRDGEENLPTLLRQADLLRQFGIVEEEEDHDALDDAKNLKKLCCHLVMTPGETSPVSDAKSVASRLLAPPSGDFRHLKMTAQVKAFMRNRHDEWREPARLVIRD